MKRSLQGTGRAFGLYLSPVLMRENGTWVPAVIYAGVFLVLVFANRNEPCWRGGHFEAPPQLSTWWWLAQQMLFACIATQYWRQVQTPLARFQPAMLRAEHNAVLLALCVAVALLSLPMLLLHAPMLNVAALVAIAVPMAIGNDLTRARSVRGKVRWLRTLLVTLLFLLFLFPGMQARVLNAPWFVALVLVAAGFTVTILELQRPVSGAVPGMSPATAAQPERLVGAERIGRAISWQPFWLRRSPVPLSFSSSAPLVLLSMAVAVTGGLLMFNGLWGAVSGRHLPRWPEAAAGARTAPQLFCMLATIRLSDWLVARRDWPFLLGMGPYGNRAAFARALFRAHMLVSLQVASICAVLACTAAWLIGMAGPERALVSLAPIAAIILGVAYLPSLTVFRARATRPGAVRLLATMGAAFGVQFGVGLFLDTASLPKAAWLGAALIVPVCAVIAWRAPAALAKTDWPIETEALQPGG